MNANQALARSSVQVSGVLKKETYLEINWVDGYQGKYHYMWLRDNCPQSQQSVTKQRIVETASIPAGVKAAEVSINEQGQVEVVWEHDKHISSFDSEWLRDNSYSNGRKTNQWQPSLWAAKDMTTLPESSYEAITRSDAALRDWLAMANDYGFAVLRNVPTEDKMVLKVANLFGYPRKTMWGRGAEHFDVKLNQGSSHLGYTSLPLLLHTDSCSFEPVPTHLMLHCLVADTEGGETVLADGFKLASDLREQAPEKFKLLSENLVTFKYKDEEKDLVTEAPIISLNERGELKAIRYSNHAAKSFDVAFDKMEAFYDAYRTFAAMRQSDTYQIKFSLKPGDFYIADNYRALHGRAAFSKGGDRHLQGCYIERGDFFNKLRVLSW